MTTVYDKLLNILESNPDTPFQRFELRQAIDGKKGSVSQAIEKLKANGLIVQIAGAWVYQEPSLKVMDLRGLKL